jgi:hypothetical protein
MIYCGSGSGSDFGKVPVPDPDNIKHSFSPTKTALFPKKLASHF